MRLSQIISTEICVCISLILSGCNQKRPERNDVVDSVPFSIVFDYATQHFWDSVNLIGTTDSVHNFDFQTLHPVEQVNSPRQFKTLLHYDNVNQIVAIDRLSMLKDNDFSFRLLYEPEWKATIIYANEHFDEIDDDSVDGFFIVYENQCYFISFDTEKMCVMLLDQNLKAMTTLRFEYGQLKFKTTVNYKDALHLYSETFYSSSEHFKLTQNTTLNELFSNFTNSNKFKFEKELVLGLLKESDHIPLWTYNGHQEYNYMAKP